MNRRKYCKFLGAGLIGGTTLGSATAIEQRVPLVSTRGHYESSWGSANLTDGNTQTNYETNGRVPGFDTGGSPEELVVFLHGWDASPETAKQFTEETTNALRANGYEHPVVGYSWDAEGSLLEWWGVTEIAEENGTKLASFLTDFRATNRDTTIRLVPYSLGARVALTACETLLDQRRMNLVTTMSLLGAAVDDTAIVEQSGYLRGITQITGQTDNFHNVDDPVLTGRYEFAEASSALGAVGANQGKPRNYDDHDVSYVDGHEEYFLEDLGVIPAVLKTW